MKCPQCQNTVKPKAKFCKFCGFEFSQKTTCPNCHKKNKGNSQFCEFCGTKIEQSEVSIENAIVKKSQNKKIIIITAIVTVCVLIISLAIGMTFLALDINSYNAEVSAEDLNFSYQQELYSISTSVIPKNNIRNLKYTIAFYCNNVALAFKKEFSFNQVKKDEPLTYRISKEELKEYLQGWELTKIELINVSGKQQLPESYKYKIYEKTNSLWYFVDTDYTNAHVSINGIIKIDNNNFKIYFTPKIKVKIYHIMASASSKKTTLGMKSFYSNSSSDTKSRIPNIEFPANVESTINLYFSDYELNEYGDSIADLNVMLFCSTNYYIPINTFY